MSAQRSSLPKAVAACTFFSGDDGALIESCTSLINSSVSRSRASRGGESPPGEAIGIAAATTGILPGGEFSLAYLPLQGLSMALSALPSAMLQADPAWPGWEW